MSAEKPSENKEAQNSTKFELDMLNNDVLKSLRGLPVVGPLIEGLLQTLDKGLHALDQGWKSIFGSQDTPPAAEGGQLDTKDKIAEGGKFLDRMPLDAKDVAAKLDPQSFYGTRSHGQHNSIDIPVVQGKPVYAGFNATVTDIVPVQSGVNSIVFLKDGSGNIVVKYVHLSRIDVKVGQLVTPETVVGLSGGQPGTPGSGTSQGPHLHMEIKYKGVHVNPYAHLAGCPDCTSNLKA